MHPINKLWPELAAFLEERVRPACDPYGLTYYHALPLSYEDYGAEGVSRQLLYISNNLLSGNKDVAKELTRWSKLVLKEKDD